MSRTFEDKPAVREAVPLIIGLVGPTGSGKTGSSLELAMGFQDVFGGDIGVIDSEARRALAYADSPMFSEPKRSFKFRHLDFKAPFGPGDYQAAIEHYVKKGVKHIICDSTSHMWEGEGGVLQIHQAEVERLKVAWGVSGDKANFPAWNKAKTEQTRFISYMKQQTVNFIFCFRAKEKMKMVNNKPVEAGWQAIGGDELLYEMSLACLLLPECDGMPIWNKAEERGVKALASQYRGIFAGNPRLSAEIGRKLAAWGKGEAPTPAKQAPAPEPSQVSSSGPADDPHRGEPVGADEAWPLEDEPRLPLPDQPSTIPVAQFSELLKIIRVAESPQAVKYAIDKCAEAAKKYHISPGDLTTLREECSAQKKLFGGK